MDSIGRVEIALLVVVAYVAVLALVRLMLGYRRQVLARLKAEIQRERRRQRQEPDRQDRPGDAA